MERNNNAKRNIALVGDLICLVFITIVGFANHGILGSVGIRMWFTILPLLLLWLVIAPFFSLYEKNSLEEPRYFWRPLLAMLFVAPTAAWLRGLWLQTPVQPVFILVLFGFNSMAILLWRAILMGLYFTKRRSYE
jgi:hypothetical protein